jgi:ribonuclease VapC
MVIDSSALVAILLAEPESQRLVQAIADADERVVAAPTIVEAAAVMLARRGAGGEIALDALVQRLDIEIVAMSSDAANFARRGYRRYGRGVGSPGTLNYGDCLAYGVAMSRGAPLLCKGEDFATTDVPVAAY